MASRLLPSVLLKRNVISGMRGAGPPVNTLAKMPVRT